MTSPFILTYNERMKETRKIQDQYLPERIRLRDKSVSIELNLHSMKGKSITDIVDTVGNEAYQLGVESQIYDTNPYVVVSKNEQGEFQTSYFKNPTELSQAEAANLDINHISNILSKKIGPNVGQKTRELYFRQGLNKMVSDDPTASFKIAPDRYVIPTATLRGVKTRNEINRTLRRPFDQDVD